MTLSQIAESYVGIHESSAQYKHKILDVYNSLPVLPRGYKVSKSDSWCAVFVSVCLHRLGIDKYNECSAEIMRRKFKITKTAKKDSVVFYDWNGSGSADHVGIIRKVEGHILTVIEGNYHDSVGVRKIDSSSKYIIGYGKPTITKTVKKTDDIDKIAQDVIAGKYGNGKERQSQLLREGFDYDKIQNRVNELLKH